MAVLAIRTLFHTISSSLKWKLIVMFFTIFLFIVFSIAIFSYMESSRNIKADAERFSTQILKEANLNLERYLREYEQFFVNVATSGGFRQWLQGESASGTILSFNQLKDHYFQPFETMHPELLSVSLLNRNGVENHYTRERGPVLQYDYSMKQESWMEEVRNSRSLSMSMVRSSSYLESNKAIPDLPVLTIVKRYEFTPSVQGYIKMDIGLEPIQAILSEVKIDDKGFGMITDGMGNVLAHTDLSRILKPLSPMMEDRIKKEPDGSFHLGQTDQLITYRSINKTDWKIISVIPYRNVARSVYRVKNMTIAISLLGLTAATFLVVIVSSSSTRRLKHLRGVMLNTNLNNLAVRADIAGGDEVADLSRVYNKMLANLEQSLTELSRSQASRQEAVLTALQSQINSHFLYNALESIKYMAYIAHQEDIVKTTLALSDMLRYVSNYQSTLVPLGQELQYVNNYMHIMHLQYGDDLAYLIEADSGVEETICLKSIIQPLVENSIKYGLEATGQPVFIGIRITQSDKYITIRITDNGPGFSQEVLQRILFKLECGEAIEQYKHLSSVGLLNVHYRLRIYHGDGNAGLQVRNLEKSLGAEVTIIMPALLSVESEGGHVQDTDR